MDPLNRCFVAVSVVAIQFIIIGNTTNADKRAICLVVFVVSVVLCKKKRKMTTTTIALVTSLEMELNGKQTLFVQYHLLRRL